MNGGTDTVVYLVTLHVQNAVVKHKNLIHLINIKDDTYLFITPPDGVN